MYAPARALGLQKITCYRCLITVQDAPIAYKLCQNNPFFCCGPWGLSQSHLHFPSTCCAAVPPGHHPLDPLTEEEVKAAADSCKQHAASLGLPPLRFNTVTLQVQHAVLTAVLYRACSRPYVFHTIQNQRCILALELAGC
jgi:Cu2+-containing amine oxidase